MSCVVRVKVIVMLLKLAKAYLTPDRNAGTI